MVNNNNEKNNKRLIHRQGRRALVRRSVRASKKEKTATATTTVTTLERCEGDPGTEVQVVDCGDGESSCSREIINYGKSKIKIIVIIRR